MFSTVRDLSSCGVIEHCTRSSFTGPNQSELLVSRCRELEVYKVHKHDGCISLLCSYKLSGRIESISTISREGEGDMVLLSFGLGRVSLVGYDESLGPHVLRMFALYNFETDALGSNLRAETAGYQAVYGYGSRAVCTVDPLGRCAAMLVNGCQVAVMPLERVLANQQDDEGKVVIEEEKKVKLAKAVRRVAMDSEDVWEMPSGCYLIDLAKVGIPACSVYHMEFLHEQRGLPVLAILHSSNVRSGTGRLVVTRWTNHLTAITISKQDITVVWKVKRLPHDSIGVVPTERGDALILAQNTIHHIVGGSVRRSVEVNGFARATADIDPSHDIKTCTEITLDGARWVWLDPYRLLLSLRLGQLVLVDIGPTDIHVSLQNQCNQATCLCVVAPHLLFLGSRLADSLLLHYKLFLEMPESHAVVSSYSSALEKLRSPTEDLTIEEEEGLLYNYKPPSQIAVKTTAPWTRCKALAVHAIDSLPCVGPVAGMCISENKSDAMEIARAKDAAKELQAKGMHSAAARLLKAARTKQQNRRKPKEIVVTAGRGRDGGIRLLCPGLRLDTSRDLLGDIELDIQAQTLWTVNPSVSATETATYVFATIYGTGKFAAMKVVASSSQEKKVALERLTDVSSFEAETSPTLSIHSSGKYIVHVTSDKIKVVKPHPPFEVVDTKEMSIRGSSTAKEYLFVIQRQSRQATILKIDNKTGKLMDMPLTQSCEELVATGYIWITPQKALFCGILRGGLGEANAGALEIYDVTANRLVFRSSHAFAVGMRVLDNRLDTNSPVESNEGILAKLKVINLCIAPVGRVEEDPHCAAHKVQPVMCVAAALSNGDLLLYKVSNQNWEKLFRVELDVVTRIDRTDLNRSRKAADDEDMEEEEEEQQRQQEREEEKKDEQKKKGMSRFPSSGQNEEESSRKRARTTGPAKSHSNRDGIRLFSFGSMGGFCGMFFVSRLGVSSCVIGSRGFIRSVRLDFDAYHVSNLSQCDGRLFVLGTSKAGARGPNNTVVEAKQRLMVFIGLRLMKYLRLDAGGAMPVVRIPLQASVTNMTYEEKSRSFIMLCGEDDASEEEALVVRSSCSVRLVCADTLQVTDEYSLMRHEKGIVIVKVRIDIAPQNTTPRKFVDYMAVGTGFVGPEGEDAGCKGRVLIFGVDMLENGKKKLALRHKIESRHIRGPVTAVASVDGLLLSTFGTTPSSLRIFYFDASTSEFMARSFYDTPFCAVSMKSIKNYLLIGDMYRSVQLVHWHNFKREFRLLARDPHPSQVYSCEFVRHERSLGVVFSDKDGNIQLLHFEYSNDLLQNRGEIHIGSCVNQIVPLPTAHDKSINILGTLDGSIHALVPMMEQTYRRLFALQAAMSSSSLVPRNAGLNPRAFRMATYHIPIQRQRNRNIADGALLWSFLTLDYISQRKLARSVGTTPETIYQDLLELDNVIFRKAL